MQPSDVPVLIRRTHEERVLEALRLAGPSTRGELGRRVGLSRTTVSEIVTELLARGALVELAPEDGPRHRGRPAFRLALEPTSGQVLGIDLGHRRVYAALVNASNEVIGSGVREYPPETPWPARLELATRLIESFAVSHGLSFAALEAVGVGVPGTLTSGVATRPGAVPPATGPSHGVSRTQLVELVRRTFAERFAGARVVVDNNTRFAGLAEAARGTDGVADSLLYVRLSDGVGGAVVVGGRLVAGASGTAGELGHVEVEPDGVPCWCGKVGCLETVASAPAIIASARPHLHGDAGLVEVAAHAGEPPVAAVLERAGAALGRALGAAATVIDPDEIVVAGDVLRLGAAFLDPARAAFEAAILRVPGRQGRLRASTLSDEAGALGAIVAAHRRSPLLAGYVDLADQVPPARPTLARTPA